MQLPEEFHLLETEKSDTYSVWTVLASSGHPDCDMRVNFREEARYHKRVRLLRCQVVEVMEEQS